MSIEDEFNSELGQEVKRLREENKEVHAVWSESRKSLWKCGWTWLRKSVRLVAQKIPSNGAFLEMVIMRFALNAKLKQKTKI